MTAIRWTAVAVAVPVLLAGVGVVIGGVLHAIQHRRPACPCGSFAFDEETL